MKLAYTTREAATRAAVRIFLPDLAGAQSRENRTQAFNDVADHTSSHVLVEDHGAPVTIFSFASSLLLFASQPTFEFRGFFDRAGIPCNLVFFRDIHRQCYHVAPDGSPTGLTYYESEVRKYMAQLGGRFHVAIGDSSGGSAAMYFGTRCGMDKVIGFSPAFPLDPWLRFGLQMRLLLDWNRAIRDWPVYRELVVIALSVHIVQSDLRKRAGEAGIWNPVETYLNAVPRPRATVFYGDQCIGDRENAMRFAACPDAITVPIATARHSIGLVMARLGELQTRLIQEVKDSLPPDLMAPDTTVEMTGIES